MDDLDLLFFRSQQDYLRGLEQQSYRQMEADYADWVNELWNIEYEGLASYLQQFSGSDPVCPGCGGESEDGDACYNCYMRSMHDYY